MIEIVEIQVGKRTKECYQYRLYAFKTDQGTFTLIGNGEGDIDYFKNLDKGTFHEWSRRQVYEWFKSGKIMPIEEAKRLDWHECMQKEKNRLESFKMRYK